MNFEKDLQHPIFQYIGEVAAQIGVKAFVIGGYVRDLLLCRPSHDIDVVVLGSGIEVARRLAQRIGSNTEVTVFKTYGTAMLHYEGMEIEFVGARRESYTRQSRNPRVEPGTLTDDQNRRDFTINALALSLNPEDFGALSDPFGGVGDLHNRIIRTPLEPVQTFSDDPLRMLRAIRFASQLGFTIADNTLEAIAENRDRLTIVSVERIATELNKILLSPVPSKGFYLLDVCGLLPIVLPELIDLKGVEIRKGVGHKDNFSHTLEVVDNVALESENLWLRWAALLHDIGKPATRRFVDGKWTFHAHNVVGARMAASIFRKLRLPLNEKLVFVQKLVDLHLRPIILADDVVTDSAVRRLLFDAGDDIDDLMLLAEADVTSKNDARKQRYLTNFRLVRQKLKEIEEKDAIRNFQPPVSGEEIMEVFGLTPCKTVGILKDAIKDAILDGLIPNSHQAAYDFMLVRAAELGIMPVSAAPPRSQSADNDKSTHP